MITCNKEMKKPNNINITPSCVSQIKELDNKRIYDRNVPTGNMQPYLSVRPVMTKYSYFPIVDPRKQSCVKLNEYGNYNINNTFNPGNRNAPWSGFATNVNTESVLRNQVYALQKCSQAVYVPNSTSDLYSDVYQPKNTGEPQKHRDLFREDKFCSFDPNMHKSIGGDTFFNSTRSQLKDLTPQK